MPDLSPDEIAARIRTLLSSVASITASARARDLANFTGAASPRSRIRQCVRLSRMESAWDFWSRKSRHWPQGGNVRPRHKPHPQWRGFLRRLTIEVKKGERQEILGPQFPAAQQDKTVDWPDW